MRKSASRNGPGEWADINAPDRRSLVGAIRRMAIKLTSKALWQLVGHTLPDGRTETRNADVFSGIGFYARPAADDRPEAIVLFPGASAGAPVVVATRNEDARKAIEAVLNAGAGLAEGEAVVYGAGALIHIKADGTVEIRTPGGAAVPLATKADIDAVATFLKKQFDTALGHTHASVGAPPTAGTGLNGTGFAVPAAAGTLKTKAE